MRFRKRGKRTFHPLPDDETDDAPFPDCEACGRPLGLHGWDHPVVWQRNPAGTGPLRLLWNFAASTMRAQRLECSWVRLLRSRRSSRLAKD
jgi:hypothetical protein